MSKYKLIKKYPGLPSNWVKGMLLGIGDRNFSHYSPCNSKYQDHYIEKSIIENSPEYWKEVYELSVPTGTKFTHRGKGIIYTIHENPTKEEEVNISWEDEKGKVDSTTYKIHNVNHFFKEGIWIPHIEKLNVPIGTKFVHKYPGIKAGSTIYTITSCNEKSIIVEWVDVWDNSINSIDYDIEEANKYFKDGIWIPYTEPKETKEYQILSYINTSNGNIFDQRSENTKLYNDEELFCKKTGTWTSTISLNKQYKIHSIKRLSDGKIFTLGDKCYNFIGVYKEIPCEHTIDTFNLSKNKKRISVSVIGGFDYQLSSLSKSKTPKINIETRLNIKTGTGESFTFLGLADVKIQSTIFNNTIDINFQ